MIFYAIVVSILSDESDRGNFLQTFSFCYLTFASLSFSQVNIFFVDFLVWLQLFCWFFIENFVGNCGKIYFTSFFRDNKAERSAMNFKK